MAPMWKLRVISARSTTGRNSTRIANRNTPPPSAAPIRGFGYRGIPHSPSLRRGATAQRLTRLYEKSVIPEAQLSLDSSLPL